MSFVDDFVKPWQEFAGIAIALSVLLLTLYGTNYYEVAIVYILFIAYASIVFVFWKEFLAKGIVGIVAMLAFFLGLFYVVNIDRSLLYVLELGTVALGLLGVGLRYAKF